MQLAEKLDYFIRLWRVVVPHIAEPSPQDVARWCEYDTAVAEGAILRTARRFAEGKVRHGFSPEEAYRYTTGVARSMTAEQSLRKTRLG